MHGFTRLESPRHFLADGKTTSDIPLKTTVGAPAVVDLTPVAPDDAIAVERLQSSVSR